MRPIFIVTFVIILGNTYSSSTITPTDLYTTGISVSLPNSTSISEGLTSETSETGTTGRATSETSTTQLTMSSDTVITTGEVNTTISSDSSTENDNSTTSSVTSSEVTTITSSASPDSTTNPSSVSHQASSTTIVSETSETSGTSSSSTEGASTSDDASTTVTESSGTSSSSAPPPNNTASTTSMLPTTERMTTNMTTEGLTTEEATTEVTTLERTTTEEPTSTSSTVLRQTITTQTTSHQTTPVYDIKDEIILPTGNAVIPVSINVTFKDCLKENIALVDLILELLKLDTCKSVTTESADSCGNDTSYTIIFRVDVLASSLLEEDTKNKTIENITTTIINITVSEITVQVLAYSSITVCNSNICQNALSNYKGFHCENNGSNCILSSPCKDNGLCSKDHGSCYVQTNGTHYLGLCKCTDDDMYTYSGSQCESKTYSWKLWTIIASGVGGGIIVILLFAVVIQCARKKAGSSNQKYGYDSGFDDRENLMYDRRYVSPDEYHRKPLPRDEDTADQVNLQSFENRGYDHWEPSDSKDTYASMDRHFQDPAFHAQITRPKLTTSKYGTDKLTPF